MKPDMLAGRKTFHTKGWIRHDNNFWFIELMDKLYQWKEKFSLLLAHSETLFIIDGIIADGSFDKLKQSLLELVIFFFNLFLFFLII